MIHLSFAIRIFHIPHHSNICGISFTSHISEPWKIIFRYLYLLSVYSLLSYSSQINEFSVFCALCLSPNHFGAQNTKMWQWSWEWSGLDPSQSSPNSYHQVWNTYCHDFTLLAMFLALFFLLFTPSSRVTQSHSARKPQKHHYKISPWYWLLQGEGDI